MLSLRTLGTFAVSMDGRRVEGFATDKERALLAYLAVEDDRPHRRDELAALLWPDLPAGKARNNFRVTLHRLRQAVNGPEMDVVRATRETVSLSPDVDVHVDANELAQKLEAVHGHGDENVLCPECHRRLTEAAGLYRGAFLAAFNLDGSRPFNDWVRPQREWYHLRVLEALEKLATYHQRRGESEAAQRYAHRQIEIEPWREKAHRQLMRALACAGEYSAALARFDACRRILAEELGVEPSEKTARLYDRIRAARETEFRPLPIASGPLIGREEELAQLKERLANPAYRLLTLVGPGGAGKSRLALEVARQQTAACLHGVCYVPLSAVDSAERLVRAIARAANYRFESRSDRRPELLGYLQQKEMLLVLDNVEHLLDKHLLDKHLLDEHLLDEHLPDARELLQALLAEAPGLKVLVTSRVRLNLKEESVFALRGLALPEREGAEGDDPVGAVRLFVERAKEAHPGFELSPQIRSSVLQLCRFLAGMPLAIELAAAWSRALTLQETLARMRQSLDFLESPAKGAPDRHRSMRASFEHSWALLDEAGRDALTKLSIFRGGFTVEAAEAIAGASVHTLISLVDRSLLWRDVAAGRLDMHDLLRHFARDKRRQAGESDALRDAHSDYYLQALARRLPELTGPDQVETLDVLGNDFANLRAAWRWAAEGRQIGRLRRSAHPLYAFLRRWGAYREGAALFGRAADSLATAGAGAEQQVVRGQMLARQAALLALLSRFDRARSLIEESLTLLPAAGALSGERAFALAQLGKLQWKAGAYAEAEASLAQSLALYRTAGDELGLALAHKLLGNVALAQGAYATAGEHCRESVALYRRHGDRLMVAFLLNNLGLVANGQDDQEQAKRFHRESLALKRELGMTGEIIAPSLLNLGWTHYLLAEYEEAGPFLREALALHQERGNREGEIMARLLLSYVARHLQERARAQKLACQALQQAANVHSKPRTLESVFAVAAAQAPEGDAAWALALITFVAEHPAADAVIRLHCEPLLERLHRSLSAAQIAAAEERAAELTMAGVVRRLQLGPCLER